MELCRTHDYKTVWGVLTSPDLYPLLGDDTAPPWWRFKVNEHPDIWYVLAQSSGRLAGLFSLIPQNAICWEVHVAMYPETPRAQKWCAARMLPAWLAEHTNCRRLVAAVPAYNARAIAYGTHGIGLRYVGRHTAAFLKNGDLHDLVLLGRSIGG